jgi:hypothetical protein
MQLHESAKNILIEQAQADVLREAFLYDVRRLEEARTKLGVLVTEGFLSEEDLDNEILESYDELSPSEKTELNEFVEMINEFNSSQLLSEAPRKAVAPANKAAAANIAKTLKAVTTSKKAVGAKKAPAKAAAAGAKKPVAAKPGAKPPVVGKAAAPVAGAKKPAARKSTPATKAVLKQDADIILAKIAKDDPQNYAKLIAAAKADPSGKQVAAIMNNPKIQQNKAAVQGQLAKTADDTSKPGLFGKIKGWVKNNPKLSAGIGLAALATLGTVATVGTAGIAPLIAASLLGAKTGAIIGGGLGGIKGAIQKDAKTGKRFGLKNIAKGVWSGIKSGAIGGAIGGGLGQLAHGAMAVGQAAQGLGGAAGVADTGADTGMDADVDNQVSSMKQQQADLMAKHPEGWNADHTKYSYHGNTADGMDVKSLGNLGSHDAGAVNSAVDTIKQHLADGDITADQAKAYMAQLKKSLAGGGGGEGEF